MVICVTKVSATVIEALYSLHVEPVHSTLICHWTLPFLLLSNRVTKIILYINNNNNHFLTTLSSKSTSTRSKYEIDLRMKFGEITVHMQSIKTCQGSGKLCDLMTSSDV